MSEVREDPIPSNALSDSTVNEPNVTQKEIFSDMLRHMMAPLVIGMVFGGIWQLTVMPRINTFVPNPVHGAFALCLITSPLIYKLLVGMEMNRAGEYAMGFAVGRG